MKRLQQIESLDSSKLRFLDIDDLIILSKLFSGSSLVATSRTLGLSQPAVSNRLRKIEQVFATSIVEKKGRSVSLSDRGYMICRRANDSLKILIGLL